MLDFSLYVVNKFYPAVIGFIRQCLLDTLNSAKLIVLRENYFCKTSTRHRQNQKQRGVVAVDSCFSVCGNFTAQPLCSLRRTVAS